MTIIYPNLYSSHEISLFPQVFSYQVSCVLDFILQFPFFSPWYHCRHLKERSNTLKHGRRIQPSILSRLHRMPLKRLVSLQKKYPPRSPNFSQTGSSSFFLLVSLVSASVACLRMVVTWQLFTHKYIQSLGSLTE